ncbi:hypothetical protein GCM10009560_13820 [Nonomuraea longicatena]|uniref:Polyketide synthase n=1 Tax=Nonomuraea longicatena TaxID=83682 RepID=A0ABP3ZCW7_9ACTN
MDTPSGLWDLVAEGRQTVGPVPPGRWDSARLATVHDPDMVSRAGRGCFLDGDVWAWDPAALSVAPAEQDAIDPQFRLVTEVAWEAVEHAGIPIDRLRGSRTGVYIGTYAPDNLFRQARPIEDAPDSLYLFGNFTAGAAGRTAFALDLRGPVMVVSTHCSSGLVAVDTACTALATDGCDTALAGGVMLMLSPLTQYLEAPWLLSQRGGCFAFDERADGYVRGEGAGMLLLKRLADARRDGDRVLAVIRGSAVNNDGQSSRLTAPSTVTQQELFRTALARGGVDPAGVGLVEAHGPGTAVGDPVEYTSINAVYGRGRGRCALGSVKTNIGHCEPVSGVAGTIKAVQALRHGVIPPNLNFRTWNPAIPLDADSRLFVPTELTPWPVEDGPRQAAVCSYGVTGTNAHLVLEQAPSGRAKPQAPNRHAKPSVLGEDRAEAKPSSRQSPAARQTRLFPLSAASTAALRQSAARLAERLTEPDTPDLADMAHTLSVRRQHAPFRLGAVASTARELADRLHGFADQGEADGLVHGTPVLSEQHPGPVFVFTGQGSQWPGMCRTLLADEPVFADVIDDLEPLIAAESGFSLRAVLTEPGQATGVGRIQPVLFAVQVALAALWRSWGVRPAAVIGHSMGEVAAAVVAGALSPADGVAVICRRSALLAEVTGGAMASVLLPAADVEADLAEAGADRVSVAVMTSDAATVISGDPAQLAGLLETWHGREVAAALVEVDVASHSPYMDPILDRLRAALADLRPREPEIAFYSTVTGDPQEERLLDAGYWADNLRQIVRFATATATALDNGHRLFIECSPHPLALRAVAEIARTRQVDDAVTVASLRRDTDSFLEHLAAVHCAGFPVDWTSRYGEGELAELPATAWNRVRHGGDDEPYRLIAPHLIGAEQHPLLGGHVQDPDRPERHWWQTPVSPHRLPWLGDHRVAGVPVMAGTGIAEMMLSAGRQALGCDRIALSDLTLRSPLVLDPEPTVSTRVTVAEDATAEVEILSATDHGPQVHARATLRRLEDPPPPATPDQVTDDWTEALPSDLYRHFRDRHDIRHGRAFAGLERIRIDPSDDTAVSTLRLDDSARASAWMMTLHPALTDELVQTVVSVWLDHYATSPGPVVVAGFEEIRVHGPTAHARQARVLLHEADDLTSLSSGVLATADGTVVAEIRGLRLSNVTPPEQRYADRLSHIAWVPTETDREPVTPTGPWLVLTDNDDTWPRRLSDALAGRTTKLPTSEEDWDALLDSRPAGVVMAIGGTPKGDPPLAAKTAVARLSGLIRRLSALPRPPRLWVTVQTEAPARVAVQAEGPAPATAGPRGVMRVAAYETPQLTPSFLDFTPDTALTDVAQDLLAPHPVCEISWRDGVRHLARLRPGPPDQPPVPGAEVRAGAAYLVTGGLTGLGLATAQWLAAEGAAHLILVGRSEPTPETAAVLSALRGSKTEVTVVRGDIADPAVAARAVAAADQHPLRGVIHSAGVVEDATLAGADTELLDRVWRGKAEGAWALHRATAGLELDFFVLYSSLASLVGSPGQAMYAAANTFLDDLADWRAGQGLPATAVHWGAWSQTGRGRHLADRGFVMISPADGTEALGRILRAGHTRLAYSPIDVQKYTDGYPALAASELLAEVRGDTPADDDSPVLQEVLAARTQTRRRTLIEQHIIDVVRDILGDTSQHIGPGTSLVILGLDSLGAVQLQVRLQNALKTPIEPGVIWVRPTPAGLTEWIMNRMGLLTTEDSTQEVTT